MSATIESTTVIARPIDEVFAGVLDLENAATFDPDVRTVTRTTTGPIGAGTTFRFHERTPPFGKFADTTCRYTAIQPGRRIDFEAQVGLLAPQGSLVFEEVGRGTRLTFHGDPRLKGLLRLLSPVVIRQARQIWDQRLARIKVWLESESRREER